MRIINTNWYGWIPTNRGKINFDFISPHSSSKSKKTRIEESRNKKIYKNLDFSYLSDNNKFVTKYLKYLSKKPKNIIELFLKADVEFELKSAKIIEGQVKIYFEDSGIDYSLKSKFFIHLNGVIHFNNINIENIEENHIYENIDIIKAIFYIVIKSIVHGDAHHHQKIDIALPVIDNDFDPKIVSNSMLDYIKLVEKNIKDEKFNKCEWDLNIKHGLYSLKGYLSYLKSFTLLFDEKEIKKDYEFGCSVVSSLENIVSRKESRINYINGIRISLISFIGLFISLNILLNGFWYKKYNDIVQIFTYFSRIDFMWISLIILMFIFYPYYKCKLHNILFRKLYDFFEPIFILKNIKLEDLNFIGKILKIVFIAFLILMVIVGTYLLFDFVIF